MPKSEEPTPKGGGKKPKIDKAAAEKTRKAYWDDVKTNVDEVVAEAEKRGQG